MNSSLNTNGSRNYWTWAGAGGVGIGGVASVSALRFSADIVLVGRIYHALKSRVLNKILHFLRRPFPPTADPRPAERQFPSDDWLNF